MASPALPEVSPILTVPSFGEKPRHLSSSSRLDSKLSNGLEQGNHFIYVDVNHVTKLLEETDSNIDEQIQACQKVAKHYEYGVPLNDLAQISKILNLCVEKIQVDNVFIEITCEILKLYGLPFYKKKLSDEGKYAKEVQESIAQFGNIRCYKELLIHFIVMEYSYVKICLYLNQKNVCNLILGILVEFCDNPKTVSHINVWRGRKDQTAANLLINLWRQEEEEMGVKHDKAGRIVDTKKPLVGQFQKTQEVIPMPASCPTIAVMDVAENMRAKIYCLICKLGFENLPGLCARDFVTLAIIRRYLDFKVGEIWDEVCAELKKEKFRPVTPDQEALQLITEALENVGKIVVSLQTEMLESQQFQELQEEEKCYGKIHSLHKQKEIVNKSWENFLARTSNYEALKKAKRLREKSIENSKPKIKHYSATFHPTDIKGLNTTVASGRLVTVESTPSELIGGPLADTDLALKKLPIRGGALKKFEGVKVIDSFKKSSVTVK
ncbi:cilia- and flagella-associated protein 69 [Notechis scutatus]|uniref:Cilia- and flagella-associated protein 69 n=1 Tax=Notechis scutatus TaxID=8663 RepID=A0A6J1V1N0_9SAUR|nr:cilia- and flagella-associated protein 69 [Notechis scutatus]